MPFSEKCVDQFMILFSKFDLMLCEWNRMLL